MSGVLQVHIQALKNDKFELKFEICLRYGPFISVLGLDCLPSSSLKLEIVTCIYKDAP